MGRWESVPLATLSAVPATLGAQVLDLLGLPHDDELLELAELGVTTLDAALAHDRAELLTDYLAFAARRVEVVTSRRVPTATIRDVPAALFAPTLATADIAAVAEFLGRALDALETGRSLRVEGATPLGELARAYLDEVLRGHREGAVAVVLDAVRGGTDVATALVEVLEPAQKEIGRLWQVGEITVAQEHYCTAITQLVMTDLYPFLFTGADSGRRLVAVQAPGSLHEVGLRMVTDLLEHEGWGTTYLGAVSGSGPVIDALVDERAHVLAISASMPAHVRAVATLIAAVRNDPRTSGVKVVVGGRPFLVAPDLVAEVGADGWAHDARETVALCSRLMESGHVPV